MKRTKIQYDVDDCGFGGTLTRLSDGKDVWMQGDDWGAFLAEWEACFTRTGRTRRMPDGYPMANYLADNYF